MTKQPYSGRIESRQVLDLTVLVSNADIEEGQVQEFAVECYKLGISHYRKIVAKAVNELGIMAADRSKAGTPITLEEAMSDVDISKEFNAMLLQDELNAYIREGTVDKSSITADLDKTLRTYDFSEANQGKLRELAVKAAVQGYYFSQKRFRHATKGKHGRSRIELSRAEDGKTKVSIPIGYDEGVLDNMLTQYTGK